MVALLRYLQSVRPAVLVLMGGAWRRHLADVDDFRDALLAEHLADLRQRGTRVYVLDPGLRRNDALALPRGQRLELRRELRLRIAGQWLWLGHRETFESPLRRLLAWARRRVSTSGSGDRLGRFAQVASLPATLERVDAIVFADRERSLRTVVGEGGAEHTLASPGHWADGHRSLEFAFGRWALRSAGGAEADGTTPAHRERFVFGRPRPRLVAAGE